MIRVFVVDTSYLTEFYSVPGFSDSRFSKALTQRMAQEVSARFHVPVGCIYKLCDHITDIPDGNLQRRLAQRVAADVQSSVERARPWVVAPARGLPDLAWSVRTFANDVGRLQLNLTNSETADIAIALKRKYGSQPGYCVHIWTRNQALKAYEPDTEPNPLI